MYSITFNLKKLRSEYFLKEKPKKGQKIKKESETDNHLLD